MAFTSVQKIRFDDVDGAGIVYYPQYFHLCHKAFEDLFSRCIVSLSFLAVAVHTYWQSQCTQEKHSDNHHHSDNNILTTQ